MYHIGGSYCFVISDILRNVKKVKLDYSNLVNDKKEIASAVCQDFMKLVLDDVINNGSRFKFSTPTEARISVENSTGEEFIKLRQNGRFYDTDPIKSNFTGHGLFFVWKTANRSRKVPITVNYELKDIITKKTNEGFKY